MKHQVLKQSFFYAVIGTVTVLSLLNVSNAQVRSSSNYQLQSDSINIGGGLSSSTSYVQESTAGEIATGQSDSASYSLRAGYQQMQEVFLSMSAPANVVISGDLGGMTGGISNGSTTVTIITDSPSGYKLTIESENDPSMQSGANSIADYVPAGAVPDYTFTTAAASANFGYSISSVDTAQQFLHTAGNVCGSGALNTDQQCWEGASTTAVTVSQSTGSNQPDGATTTINFRVGINNGANIIAGEYVATTTITALPL